MLVDKIPDQLEEVYLQLKDEDVLVEELIVQHPEMCFGNMSVNTIRTHTILDRDGKAHVIKAILRVGVGSSMRSMSWKALFAAMAETMQAR